MVFVVVSDNTDVVYVVVSYLDNTDYPVYPEAADGQGGRRRMGGV